MTGSSDWSIEFSSGIPVYKQIINLVYFEIGSGNLCEGDRLPTIKELAERFKVNPNTIAKAYRELDIKGVISSRRGDGSFVSALLGKAPPMTKKKKEIKLNELFGQVIAEAKSCGISEQDILEHVKERIQEHGKI